ncbi:SseB family protein [Brevundimonas sp. R86498]|uniref:SseB family protein n=1 Tax=Brevundimonas sp. R86498 TaxID=3093845 RepID=UPI0037CA84A8
MRFRQAALITAMPLALGLLAGCVRADLSSRVNGRPTLAAENGLESAVVAFAHSPTPATEASLGRSLLGSTVYVRVDDASVDDRTESASSRTIQVWSVTLPDGRAALAVYTSKTAFASAFRDEPRSNYIGLSGRAALELASIDQPVAINWGVDPHVYWEAGLTRTFLAMP